MTRQPIARTTLGRLQSEDVIRFSDGYRTRQSEHGPGLPILRVREVDHGCVRVGNSESVREEFRSRIGAKVSSPGDVLVTTKGSIGRVARIPDGFPPHVYAPQLCFIRVIDSTRIDPGWLYGWMRSPLFSEQLGAYAYQTDMAPYLSLGDLQRFWIDLPPLDVQRQIAGVLGALDDLVETNGRLIPDLSKSLSAAFQVAQRSFTGAAEPIGDVLEVVGGSTPSTSVERYWGGGISWATPKDLSGASSAPLLSTGRTISAEGLEQVSCGLLPPGTVLLSSRAPIGYLAIAEVPVAVNQGFIAIRATDRLPSLFVLEWLRANMDAVESRAGGTTFKEISRAAFRPIPIDVPSPAVISQFCAAAEPCYRAIVELERESAKIRSARDELLPLLMSGRVTPGEVA